MDPKTKFGGRCGDGRGGCGGQLPPGDHPPRVPTACPAHGLASLGAGRSCWRKRCQTTDSVERQMAGRRASVAGGDFTGGCVAGGGVAGGGVAGGDVDGGDVAGGRAEVLLAAGGGAVAAAIAW